jgi:predicted DCC family thiol-disulfide oxidoreductase YuxK
MTAKEHLRVSNPPAKPLMIWDGECHFCRRWIERWGVITAGEVDYATYQEIADRFPEIPHEQFQRSVVYIDKNGEVFTAAEAVYRSLRCRSSRKWLSWSYDHVPGFAAISEFGYRLVARNRKFGSAITRMLWGEDVRPPTYFWARKWFLRALGLVYLVAFVSFWTQIDGLVGANGILPIANLLSAAREQVGWHAMSILPTLCWLNSSDTFLHFLCGGGVALSLLLIFEIAPLMSLIGLFVFYLSLTIAGQTFLSFQWDILLLEAGFLSIFLAPWRLWRRRTSVAAAVSAANNFGAAGDTPATTEELVSRVALFLLKLLLFKLLLMSGVVKLTSGDDCWWNLTALDYHYWSQPLPTVFAWWADRHPEWFKHFSVAFCLVVEIVVPFLFWAPRRLRLVAAGLIIFLQIAIAITGNYCFFNLITIALCLLLIDDAVLKRKSATVMDRRYSYRLSIFAAVAVLIVTLPLNGWLIYSAFKPDAEWPRPLRFVYEHVEPFRIVNGYGLFRVMTKERREIVIEGSADGIDWRPYEFKWKPGDVKHAPGWCAPHQPRLDWQMWFAALSSYERNRWFQAFVVRLLQNKPEVTGLLKRNPFPDSPPRYVRALFYDYRFTNAEEHRQTGAWWKRRELGEYMPEASLRSDR